MDMYFIKSTNKGYRSRPRGSEMPHADPPEDIAGHKEQHGGKRREHEELVVTPSDEVKKRIILPHCHGNDEGEELQNTVSVNRKRIGAELTSSVGEDVHELQSFRGEKADGCIDHEKSRKLKHTAGDHENQRENFIPFPHNAAAWDHIGEDDHSLNESSEAGQLYLRCNYLKNKTARTEHDSIKLTV